VSTITQGQSLTTAPVPKLLLSIAIPASIGFFFNTMYNVVDTWVAGQISGEALAALSLTFPVFFIIIAVSYGVGTGVTALISNELGAQQLSGAKRYATQALSFGLITSLILAIAGYFISPVLFKLLGANGVYLATALAYMQPVFLGSVFLSMTTILSGVLNAIGDTKSFRNVLIFGFFVNLLLSPMLAFGWLGLPALGIFGIAIATIFTNFLGSVYLFRKVWQTELLETDNLWAHLLPQRKAFTDIATQGFPASFSMMTIAIGSFVITYFVSQYGGNAVAGYGAALRIEQIVLIPGIGINIAVLTLIGQNNGAKRFDRIREIITVGLKYVLLINTVGAILIFFGAGYLLKIFTDITEIVAFGSEYLVIAAFISWAYGIIFITDSVLRGLKKPLFPLILGTVRQAVIPIPVFYLVTFVFSLTIIGLWWSVFAIVWVSALVSLAYMYWVLKGYNVNGSE
jgi:putative MATE family efflux protein